MKRPHFYPVIPSWRICLIGLALLPMSVKAVIVAGANGGADNLNNTTQLQLENVSGVSDGHFLNNVFMIGGSIPGSGVYIGFKNTGSGRVGYALSAMHLGAQSTLTIQSQTFQVQNRFMIDGSDLALFEFTHTSDFMPALQEISLSSSTPNAGNGVVMIGGGRNREQDATTQPNSSDAVAVTNGIGYTSTSDRLIRWGTNSTVLVNGNPTDTFSIASRETVVTGTVFNSPANGQWLSSNEAQGVAGDSGGGLFAFDGTLLGIMAGVSHNPNTQAHFGAATFSSDIASYKSSIDFLTGAVLIPEPGSILLMSVFLGCFAGICGLRKCRKHQ